MNDQSNFKTLNCAYGQLMILQSGIENQIELDDVATYGVKGVIESVIGRLEKVLLGMVDAGDGELMSIEESLAVVRAWRQCDSCNATV
jgi:hypothetical protein